MGSEGIWDGMGEVLRDDFLEENISDLKMYQHNWKSAGRRKEWNRRGERCSGQGGTLGKVKRHSTCRPVHNVHVMDVGCKTRGRGSGEGAAPEWLRRLCWEMRISPLKYLSREMPRSDLLSRNLTLVTEPVQRTGGGVPRTLGTVASQAVVGNT